MGNYLVLAIEVLPEVSCCPLRNVVSGVETIGFCLHWVVVTLRVGKRILFLREGGAEAASEHG